MDGWMGGWVGGPSRRAAAIRKELRIIDTDLSHSSLLPYGIITLPSEVG